MTKGLIVQKARRLHRRWRDAKSWVRYRVHPKYRLHVIRTGLEPGWHDEDTLILHGSMAMLCRYIQWHGTEASIEEHNAYLRNPANDPYAPDELKSRQADMQEEALAIYRWWKNERPQDENRRAGMIKALYGTPCTVPEGERKEYQEAIWALEEKINDDEQKMLHRLIDIRQGLWT